MPMEQMYERDGLIRIDLGHSFRTYWVHLETQLPGRSTTLHDHFV